MKLTNKLIFLIYLGMVIILFTGCGGSKNTSVIPAFPSSEKSVTSKLSFLNEADEEKYYAELEKSLNDKLSAHDSNTDANQPQGLSKIVLSSTTDEISTLSSYNLSEKITATALSAGNEPKIITPVWQIYSGGGSISGTVYTSVKKSETVVLTAAYSENGISRLALFRLKVNGLEFISLSRTTAEIQMPAQFNLDSELTATANYADGSTREISSRDGIIWEVSGGGTLNGTIYTPASNTETAVFTAIYTESGITKKAAFALTINGLRSISLNRATDEIQLPAGYDLGSELIAEAHYSDQSTKEITHSPMLAWTLISGSGTLNGNIYSPPGNTETAIFSASYSESGVSKTAEFILKITEQPSIFLNITTDEIQGGARYDLSKLSIISKFPDGTEQNINNTPETAWTLISGKGNLSGTIYFAPAATETAVFLVSHGGSGISGRAYFRLKVNSLTSISLSKAYDDVCVSSVYDLGSEIAVNAKYSNKKIIDVTRSPELSWKLISGSGTLAGTIYTPPAKTETAVFTATFSDAGIAKTAKFKLKTIGLNSIELNKLTDEIQSCSSYNLASLIIAGKFSDNTVKDLTNEPNTYWKLISGKGSLSAAIYTASDTSETAVFSARHKIGSITKSAIFKLKVNALKSIFLSKKTDEIQLPAAYNLCSELIVKAAYSIRATQEVTNSPALKWELVSGKGKLDGPVYITPGNPEKALIMAAYSESGITKTAKFTLKITDPSTLSVSKTSDTTPSCSMYNLSKNIIVTNKLSDGAKKNVTQNKEIKWSLVSGSGIFNENIYTAPAIAETAVFLVRHAKSETANSAYFRLKVKALTSIYLSVPTGETQINTPYDLSANLKIYAKFSNGDTEEITNNPNMTWLLSSGSGNLNGKVYIPSLKAETAVLTAIYTAAGITQNVQFKLKVTLPGSKIQLTGISLNKTTDEVTIGGSYNLNNLTATAKYSDKTTEAVKLNWLIISGGGIITDNIFMAPNNPATIKLMGTLISTDNTVKSTYFSIKISDKERKTIK